MIKLLTDEEAKHVDKPKVILTESAIIKAFNFDFGFLSPLPFLERFLRLTDFLLQDKSPQIKKSSVLTPIAVDLLKFIHSRNDLLWTQPPSILAAAILSVAHRVLSSQYYLSY
jgi:hypothetical protein